MLRRVSRFWSHTFRSFYWVITHLQPLVRPWAQRGVLGNVVELIVTGRRTGRRRVVLLGLLRVGDGWYLGHPNGEVAWTRNLDAASSATLVIARQPIQIRPELLPVGEERRRVIAATWHQHVFPGNLMYWLARRHILAIGRYYRIEPQGPPPDPSSTKPATEFRTTSFRHDLHILPAGAPSWMKPRPTHDAVRPC